MVFSYRLLLIEDDHSVTRMLRFSLTRAGFEVIEVATGREALQVLEQQSLDAVVLDLGLPEGLGKAVLDRLRQLGQRKRDAPVWIITSALDREEATKLYGPLESYFLAKPFDPWELIRILEDLLTTRRAVKRPQLRQEPNAERRLCGGGVGHDVAEGLPEV